MGKRGIKQAPVEIQKIKGHYKPSRHDNDIDDSKSLTFVEDSFPVPPDNLTELESFYWHSVIGQASKVKGWISHIDLFLLKRWCISAAHLDSLDEQCKNSQGVIENNQGNLIINPIYKLRETTEKTFIKLCADFGFSPSARTAIKLGQSGDQPQENIYKI